MFLTLLVLSLGASRAFEVERYDSGDAFSRSTEKDCAHFNGYSRAGTSTPDCNTTLGCCCQFGDTFYTVNSSCESLYDENSEVPGKCKCNL